MPVMIVPGSVFHPIPSMMRLVLGAAKDKFRGRCGWEQTSRDQRDCREQC
jgi:hypothetical protein